METPIVRLLSGSTLETMSIVAGNEMAVQERKKMAPMITACHEGMRITMVYPNIASRLKRINARL